MKAVIQFTKPEEARALPLLLRHSPGTVLPNRTYVLDEEALGELRRVGNPIRHAQPRVVSPGLEGVGSGERV